MRDKDYSIPDLQTASCAREDSCAIAVMVKTPRAGAVKTRLVPPLTHDEAAALSACFLRDTAANVAGVKLDECGVRGIAVYTPIGAESEFHKLLPDNFVMIAQRGESLTERLGYATEDLLAAGYESLCLIGADSPTLPSAVLAQAMNALARPGDRVVLGPSDDGGYYLIGLKRVHWRMFEDIEWSTPNVFRQTVERAAEIKLEVVTLPVWYDVDDAATLVQLCDEIFPPARSRVGGGDVVERSAPRNLVGYDAPHTRRFLAEVFGTEGRQRLRQHADIEAKLPRRR